MSVDILDLELFQKNWSTYETIIDENYMFHREINQGIQSLVSNYFGQTPVTVLDLGCGDASSIEKTLKGLNIEYFCGYDLSALALKSAESNVAKVVAKYDLHCQDMLEGVAKMRTQFDLVLSSYSLHHLDLDDKVLFFSLVHRTLKNSGMFILVDTVKDEKQSLGEYYDDYLGYACQHWNELRPDELKRVSEHVRSSDYPESTATLEKMGDDAGFIRHKTVAKYQYHHLTVFYKSNNYCS